MLNCKQNGLFKISFWFSSQKVEFQQLSSTPLPSFLESFSSHPTLHTIISPMLVINLKFYASGREWLVSWPECTFVLHPYYLYSLIPFSYSSFARSPNSIQQVFIQFGDHITSPVHKSPSFPQSVCTWQLEVLMFFAKCFTF